MDLFELLNMTREFIRSYAPDAIVLIAFCLLLSNFVVLLWGFSAGRQRNLLRNRVEDLESAVMAMQADEAKRLMLDVKRPHGHQGGLAAE